MGYAFGATLSLALLWIWSTVEATLRLPPRKDRVKDYLLPILLLGGFQVFAAIAHKYVWHTQYRRSHWPLDPVRASAVLRLEDEDGKARICHVWLFGEDRSNGDPIVLFKDPCNRQCLTQVPDAVRQQFPDLARYSTIWVSYSHQDGWDHFTRLDFNVRPGEFPKEVWDPMVHRKISAAAGR